MGRRFPLLEWDEEEKRFYAMHHPFTSPVPEDLPLMETDPGKVRADAYDLVINGVEIGGGSIRIHDAAVQKLMFKVLGFSDEEANEQFGFLLNAFKFGAPHMEVLLSDLTAGWQCSEVRIQYVILLLSQKTIQDGMLCLTLRHKYQINN